MNTSLRRFFTALLKDERGQDLIEYALIAAFIGLGAMATVQTFAATVSSALTTVGARLTSHV